MVMNKKRCGGIWYYFFLMLSNQMRGMEVYDLQKEYALQDFFQRYDNEGMALPAFCADDVSMPLLSLVASQAITKSRNDKQNRTNQYAYRCSHCDIIISSRRKNAHELFHDQKTPDELKCLICNMGFLYKSVFLEHNKKVHTKSRND